MHIRTTSILLLSCVLLSGITCYAEEKIRITHQIVLEITGDGDEHWNGMVNNLKNIQSAFGSEKTNIEVVVHGKAIGLLLGVNKEMADRLADLSHDGVAFVACENTMKRHGVTKDQLHPFAMTVDAGVAEVVRKQEAGWSYVRLDH